MIRKKKIEYLSKLGNTQIHLMSVSKYRESHNLIDCSMILAEQYWVNRLGSQLGVKKKGATQIAEHLPGARLRAGCFRHIISFIPDSSLMRDTRIYYFIILILKMEKLRFREVK